MNSRGSFGNIDPSSGSDLAVGQLLAGKYEILELLGSGGMGSVYKALNRVNQQLRAIKVMHPRLVSDSMSCQRFMNEASAAARMQHPTIVKILDVATLPDGRPFLVMEYLSGESLAMVLNRGKVLSAAVALSITSQICTALVQAHSRGIIHRDIKPSNVMLIDHPENQYLVKVVDFGIAKLLPEADDATKLETRPGEIFGSPPYMSPEQCLGQVLDQRSDIYSLGCLMYEALSGAPPLVGNNPISTMYRQINEIPAPFKLHEGRALEYAVNRIIAKALQKEPSQRYQSALELQQAIEKLRTDSNRNFWILFLSFLPTEEIKRLYLNQLGSSKRPLELLLIAIVIALCLGSTILLPFAFSRYPNASETVLKWRELPALLDFNQELNFRLENRRHKLIQLIQQNAKTYRSSPNPESISLHREIADIHFIERNYRVASAEYQIAVSEGLKLFKAVYKNFEAPPAFLHDICVSYLRFSQCQMRISDYLGALNFAKAGLALSFADADHDVSYKGYFAQVIAVSSIHLTNRISAQSAEYISRFAEFVDSRPTVGLEAGQQALALSEIADCYCKLGNWNKAIFFLKKSKELWSRFEPLEPMVQKNETLIRQRPGTVKLMNDIAAKYARTGKCGPYNSAVASELIAFAYEHLGDFQSADTYFEQAGNEFELIGGRSDQSRCLILFARADELWKHGLYFRSLELRIDAQRIWMSEHYVIQRNKTKNEMVPKI